MIRQDELRKSLADLKLNEEDFARLRQISPEELSLQQYTAVSVNSTFRCSLQKKKRTNTNNLMVTVVEV